MPTSACRAFRILPGARAIPLALAVLLIAFAQGRAADVVVLTAGAFKPVLLDLDAAYEARTGNTLAIANDTAGGVAARIMRGEESDVVVLPAAAFDELVAKGKVVADSVVPVAKSGIGVAVKTGEKPPDISTVEAFKRTLLDAPSVAYIDPASGGSSGIYLARLFTQLGVADAIQRKAVLVPGGLAASRVSDGEAALALQQTSELLVVSGVTVIGPLPAAIQHYTTYAAGIPTSARRPAAGRTLLTLLRGEAAVRALTAHGLDSP
jgi:molybdate transport system substrate-binding protein